MDIRRCPSAAPNEFLAASPRCVHPRENWDEGKFARGSMLITVFGRAPKEPPAWVDGLAQMTAINAAAAVACVALALVYLVGALPLIDLPPDADLPAWAWALQALVVLAIAILGAMMGAVARNFPWLAAFLTPLLFGVIASQLGPDGFSGGLRTGGYASVVFLLGALAGRGIKRWRKVRKANNPALRPPL